jgi:predicted nuclease of predicted toxin-antitoxin system
VTIFWVDAQLPPQLAAWLRSEFGYDAHALRELGLRDADDQTIFEQARIASVILLSKDVDWFTCGNVSNEALRALLLTRLHMALTVLESDDIVEIA